MEFSRVDRLQSQMIKELALIISEDLKDAPPFMITFTRSEITKDLKQAKVYFSVFGDKDAVEQSFEFLKRHMGIMKKMLGSRMRMRHSPEIIFKYDGSTENVLRINELLDKIKKQDDTGSDK